MTELEAKILNKVSNLTSSQKEYLDSLLDNPNRLGEPTKEDILVLSSFLIDLRNTKAYKNKSKHGSVEKAVYNKYIKTQEKQVELEVFNLIRNAGGQLRKGGCEKMRTLCLDEEEMQMVDSIFPENASDKKSIVVPFSEEINNMGPQELLIRDLKSNEKHNALKSLPKDWRSAYESNETPETLSALRANLASVAKEISKNE